ncbi:fimbria/pilus outer membrane usher protein [Pseudomonas umsongensis]|uniref:fimbria/pilus outer membrane usher protein n=1 Tax=Pseudomonas umsongensis TaxID=198618 RepID=UPI00200B3CE3|nr:fimbria/pilus outer membrane usher protein [Pseudomonas umsongensis]MCK8684293.1 fimbrial biogenesis outer membrane usher protein [Pseudomonas umsongensis]
MFFLPWRFCSSTRQRLFHFIVIGGGSAAMLETRPVLANQPIEFQSTFMRQLDSHARDAGAVALNALAERPDLGPGRYQVSIHVNQRFFDRREIEFMTSSRSNDLAPCLPAELLNEMGVKLDALTETQSAPTACIDIERLIPGASTEFDASQLLLSISIPQIAMRRAVTNHVDPKLWDSGINAAFISYQASAQQGRHASSGHSSSQDLYLNSGINLGAWRLRSNNAFRHDDQGQREWTRAYTYVQRDLPGTRSQMTLGETITPGDVFRSLPIKGVQIASDMEMLPDTLQSYAPVIRGVAQTRAKLEIRQNGFPIYSTYVSAGPYEIDDLSIGGGSGELEIILTEADGQVQRFTQSYSTLSNLLREGVWRYSATAGRYNAASVTLEEPMLWQGTLALGATANATVYGGLLASDFYRAGSLGIGRNLGSLGALSFDLTRSSAYTDPHDRGQNVQGTSFAVKYGKSFETRTNLRFAGYRYSTEGYRDLDETLRERSNDSSFIGSRRSRLEAAISQSVGTSSSFNLSVSQENYWRTDYQQRQFQFQFNTQHKNVSYNLYASQSLSDTRLSDRQISFGVSMPLDFGRSTTATFDVRESAGKFNQRASLSGSVDQNRMNYRASLANSSTNQQTAELSMGYQASAASIGAGMTQGSHYNSQSLNVSGALLLHEEGLELGPYLGETSGLVHVPDIAGVGVLNATAVKTNDRGYALIPYLRPYRINRVVLDNSDLSPNIEIDNGVAHVVPRRGSVVRADFAARKVQRLILTALDVKGAPLPFGAQVSDANGHQLGIIGQAGQFMMDASGGVQTLNVRWGETSAEHCQLQVDVDRLPEDQGYRIQQLPCSPASQGELFNAGNV